MDAACGMLLPFSPEEEMAAKGNVATNRSNMRSPKGAGGGKAAPLSPSNMSGKVGKNSKIEMMDDIVQPISSSDLEDDDDDDEEHGSSTVRRIDGGGGIAVDSQHGKNNSHSKKKLALDAIHENSHETRSSDDDEEHPQHDQQHRSFNYNHNDHSNNQNNKHSRTQSTPANTGGNPNSQNTGSGLDPGGAVATRGGARVDPNGVMASRTTTSSKSQQKHPVKNIEFEDEKKEDSDGLMKNNNISSKKPPAVATANGSNPAVATRTPTFFESLMSRIDPTIGMTTPTAASAGSATAVPGATFHNSKGKQPPGTPPPPLTIIPPSGAGNAVTIKVSPDGKLSGQANAQGQKDDQCEDDATRIVVKQELASLEELDDRNFDINPTDLYVRLMKKDWNQALLRIIEHPIEASTWIHRMELDNTSLRWRLLPIHAAIIFNAPEKIVDALITTFPDCVLARDDQGMMPIHLGIRMGSPQAILMKLLKANPETIEKRDSKGRTPRNLVENSRGAHRESFMELLINAPKTQQQLRDEVIAEQQGLFEQVLAVVKKEHTSEVEKLSRESVANRIQLNAQIEVLRNENVKLLEKNKLALAGVADIEERLKHKIESELAVIKQVQDLEAAVLREQETVQKLEQQLEHAHGEKAQVDLHVLELKMEIKKYEELQLSIEKEREVTETVRSELESVRSEKIDIERLLDVSVRNYEHAVMELNQRDSLDMNVVHTMEKTNAELQIQIKTLERLLQERTESEQALAWQVSALAEKLGAFGPSNDDDNMLMMSNSSNHYLTHGINTTNSSSASEGSEARYFDTGDDEDDDDDEFAMDAMDENLLMTADGDGNETGKKGSDDVTSSSTTIHLLEDQKTAATTVSSSTTRKKKRSQKQRRGIGGGGLLEPIMGFSSSESCGGEGESQSHNSEQIRALEREREELKSTVNKLSIKLYKVVGFLDEMVHEQEAIVREAMKRDTLMDDNEDGGNSNDCVENDTKNDETMDPSVSEGNSRRHIINLGENTEYNNEAQETSKFNNTTESSEQPQTQQPPYKDEDNNVSEPILSSSFMGDTTAASTTAEQILDSVPPSDRKQLVEDVTGMKTQILGVIDSVIGCMPKHHHSALALEDEEDDIFTSTKDNVVTSIGGGTKEQGECDAGDMVKKETQMNDDEGDDLIAAYLDEQRLDTTTTNQNMETTTAATTVNTEDDTLATITTKEE